MNGRLLLPERSAAYPTRGIRGYAWIAAALLVLAALAIPVDVPVAHFIRFGDIPGDLRRVLKLSELFAHGFGVFLATVLILALAPAKRQFVPRVLACALWSGLLAQGLKLLVARIRPGKVPADFDVTGWSTWGGWLGDGNSGLNLDYVTQSFPSGHTATAVGLAIGLAWLFPRGKWLFLGMALMAAWQRIDSNAHWLSDVLAGAAVGFMGAGAVTQNWGFGKWLGRWERRITEARIARGQLVLGDQGALKESPQADPRQDPSRKRVA